MTGKKWWVKVKGVVMAAPTSLATYRTAALEDGWRIFAEVNQKGAPAAAGTTFIHYILAGKYQETDPGSMP